LNENINRDWNGFYALIGRANINIDQVQKCVDPALSATRKNQILAEARFMRAFAYFDLVRLFGRVPIMLAPPRTTNAEDLLKSVLVAQSSTDSVYDAILQDLWFAKASAMDVGASPSKYIVSKGAANAALAKVYASMPTPNWDSVKYYCDQVIPKYSLVADFRYLWDNAHDNNSEAIWEINYDGYSNGDQVGNWAPSIFVGGSIGHYEGGGWKKFTTPSNDLVNAYTAEGDNIRLNATITFVNITGQWTDPYWPGNHYPFLTKYNDPSSGINDFYMIRLPDIMLLKAEALVSLNDIPGAMALVTQVRARVGLGPKTAANADAARQIIANERRLELAFEGHRWYDLLRTGKAVEVMNAQKDGAGNNLNYNVAPFRVLFPIPQVQIDLNPLLTQNPDY
jgi:starch-binding outer membrane protein, SusD/RagB family